MILEEGAINRTISRLLCTMPTELENDSDNDFAVTLSISRVDELCRKAGVPAENIDNRNFSLESGNLQTRQ